MRDRPEDGAAGEFLENKTLQSYEQGGRNGAPVVVVVEIWAGATNGR